MLPFCQTEFSAPTLFGCLRRPYLLAPCQLCLFILYFSVFGRNPPLVLAFRFRRRFLALFKQLGKIFHVFSKSILKAIRFILGAIYKLLVFPLVFVFKKITKCLFTKTHSLVIMLKRIDSVRRLKREKKALYRKAHFGFQ